MTEGICVTLDDYGQLLDVDPQAQRVTVQAGMRLRDLNRELRRHGLAMPSLGSISEQSVAGAISTATHGSGLEFGNLAAGVVAMRLVDGRGQVHVLTREDADRDPESDDGLAFRAACVGIGALGVISTVTLDVEPAFNLREETQNTPLAQLLDDPDDGQAWLDRELASVEHLKLWWLPHTDVVRVYRAERTTDSPTPRDVGRRFEESVASRALFAGLLRLGSLVPPLVPRINALVQRVHFVDGVRVAPSEAVFNVAQVPVHHEMEYAVPLERTVEALGILRTLIDRERLRVNFIVEARFVAADDLLLSPAFGRPSCQIGAYAFPGVDSTRYFEHFERTMLALGGRPHWGKSFAAERAALAPNLPGLEAFDDVRDRLDPDRRFANRFTRRVLGD